MKADREMLKVDPALALALVYHREIRAGIERVWENVFDWEHLPVLHESYFDAVELLDSGSWGWRVALTKRPGTLHRRLVVELNADRAKARYRVRTLAGDGTGTEIWTLLEPLGAQRTAVEVQYYLPERQPERLRALAEKYRASAGRLWDEDEAMMMRREAMLARGAAVRQRSAAPLRLGPVSELRRRLPLIREFDGEEYRIVALEDGALFAHATTCPHWLGPLHHAASDCGVLRCPWHGYLFDLRTGKSADGRGYRLALAPRVIVDPVSGEASLTRAA
jgi:nitrite reductase/ring-hydroxylating ferredoxin subunit